MSVAAIILAAGASRRLGQLKQLVRVAGETLLGKTMRLAQEAGASPVLVVLGAESERISAALDWSDAIPVLNNDWETGMASSIRSGVLAVRQQAPEATAVLLLVCDQARLTAEHLRQLIAASSEDIPCKVASLYAGANGVPAIFPVSEFPRLMALEGDAGARSLFKGPVRAIEFQEGYADIDTIEDLRQIIQSDRAN